METLKRTLTLTALMLASLSWAESYPMPAKSNDLIGTSTTVHSRYEDTLLDIARANNLGYFEIVHANKHVDPWLPGEDTEVLLPKQFILPNVTHHGIIINLAEMRLYYFPKTQVGHPPSVTTHPISIGRMDWTTPLGKTYVSMRIKDPAWYPPKSILEEHAENGQALPNSVPPGPDNPLGAYAMQLAIPGYLIHGTNKPWGIGMPTTHGCIRMYPEDIERLFQLASVNTPVHIVNLPIKVGWLNNELYLEVHPTLDEDIKNHQKGMTGLVEQLIAATHDRQIEMDWETIKDTYRRATGVPTKISVPPNQTPGDAGSNAGKAP